MRIWSLHPKYLDAKGLVALWRETLLAQHVLEGKTKGYKNHPQLERFKSLQDPIGGINSYLETVCNEADSRNYHFDRTKIGRVSNISLKVTTGQLAYENQHLLAKLKQRDLARYKTLLSLDKLETHPLFKLIKGEIEDWEIISI